MVTRGSVVLRTLQWRLQFTHVYLCVYVNGVVSHSDGLAASASVQLYPVWLWSGQVGGLCTWSLNATAPSLAPRVAVVGFTFSISIGLLWTDGLDIGGHSAGMCWSGVVGPATNGCGA